MPADRLSRAAIAAAIVFAIGAPSAWGQSEVQAWSAVGVERELSDRVDIGVEQHLRFGSELEAVLTDVGLHYRAQKWLRLGAGYRFGVPRTGSGDFEVRHRLHVEASLRGRTGKLRLELRTRWQETLRGATAGDGVRHKWRNRGQAEYKLSKRTRPFAGVELFHAIGNGDGIVFDTLRFTAGASHRFGSTELEGFYRIEEPIDDMTAPTLHIIGVGVSASI